MKRATIGLVLLHLIILPASVNAQSFYDNAFGFVGAGNPSNIDYSLLDRPMTLKSGFELNARFNHVEWDLGIASASISSMTVSAAFAVTEKIEVGFETGLVLDPEFDWLEVLSPRAVINLISSDFLDLAVDAVLPLNFGDMDNILSITYLGAPMRLKLTPQLALLAGHSAIAFGLGDRDYIAINANVGLAFQALPILGLRLDTQILTFVIEGDAEVASFNENIPLSLSAVLSFIDNLDIFVSMAMPDVQEGFDLLFINFGGSFRL